MIGRIALIIVLWAIYVAGSVGLFAYHSSVNRNASSQFFAARAKVRDEVRSKAAGSRAQTQAKERLSAMESDFLDRYRPIHQLPWVAGLFAWAAVSIGLTLWVLRGTAIARLIRPR